MKTGINVKLQTGMFERTDFKMNIAPEGLTFKPSKRGGDTISFPVTSIREITFYGARLQMEVQTNTLTDAFFANGDDFHDAINMLKETLKVKIICEFN